MGKLCQELNNFISACDALISLNARVKLSASERLVIDYYLREMPVLLPMK